MAKADPKLDAALEEARTLRAEVERLRTLLAAPAQPLRRRLPDERAGKTHHFVIRDTNTKGEVVEHDGYITVGFYPDGAVGEVFIRMAKTHPTVPVLLDALATAVSLDLQHGVSLETLVNKFEHLAGPPAGQTANPAIPFCRSPVDYVAKYLKQFVPKEPG